MNDSKGNGGGYMGERWSAERIRSMSIAVLVAVGMILAVAALGAQFPVGNLHLVLFAGVGFVWLHRVHRHPMASSLIVWVATVSPIMLLLMLDAGRLPSWADLQLYFSVGVNLLVALFAGAAAGSLYQRSRSRDS